MGKKKTSKMVQSTDIEVATRDGGTSTTFQCMILNETNCTIWAIHIKELFNIHGIRDTLEPKEETRLDQKKNNMTIAKLYQAIPENMILQIANLTSVKEIWDALKIRNVGVDRVKEARIEILESVFEYLNINVNETLNIYAGKISHIATQVSCLGHTINEKILVRKLLGFVQENFIQIVASIEQFFDLNTMTFQEAVGRLKASEELIKKQNKEEDVYDKLLYNEANGINGG